MGWGRTWHGPQLESRKQGGTAEDDHIDLAQWTFSGAAIEKKKSQKSFFHRDTLAAIPVEESQSDRNANETFPVTAISAQTQ